MPDFPLESLSLLFDRMIAVKAGLERNIEAHAASLELNAAQLLAVIDVVEHPGTELGALCRRSGIKKSAASKTVDTLVERGMLTRGVGHDRRSLAISPGPVFSEGRFCRKSALEQLFPGWARMGDALDTDEILRALSSLEALVGAVTPEDRA